MNFNIRKQKALLAECVVSKVKDARIKVILDTNNDDYFIQRALEDLSCALEAGPMARQALIKRVITLLNIVRYRYNESKAAEESEGARS